MRAYHCLVAGLVAAAAVAAPASAQSPTQNKGSWNFSNVRNMTFQPIDTRNANSPISQPQNLSISSSLINYFHKFSVKSSKPVVGQTNFPTPSQLPNQNYLSSFQLRSGAGN